MDDGILDVFLDYPALKMKKTEELILKDEPSLWRYFPLIPVKEMIGEGTTLRSAGWTPVFSPPQIKNKLGLKQLWIKDESSNPTASFKDRASAILVARAREIGAEVIVTASTGNAGAALAGMAAAVDQESVIFAPKTAPPAKIAQLLIYGARVILVDDNYDAACKISLEASEEFGWYNRNTGYNPFTAEGKKTAAYEIWEQVLLANQLDRPYVSLSLLVMEISYLESTKGSKTCTRSVRSKSCLAYLAASPLVQQRYIMPTFQEKKRSFLLRLPPWQTASL